MIRNPVDSSKAIRFFAVLGLLALLTPLGGCSTNPATGEQNFTAFMSPEKEAEVGSQEHPKILEQYGGAYEDPRVNQYIRELGLKLARQSELPNLPYTFTVLNDDIVNAFALPGGFVYISRGLLGAATNEAEVAGVLAHEIGHITARHTAQRYSSAQAANIGLTVLGVLGSIAGVPTGTGQLASFGAQAWLQSFSREQELEADMLGVRYMTRVGYDPQGMVTFFQKLQENKRLTAELSGDPEAADRYSIMDTHPRTAERIIQAGQLAEATPVSSPKTGQLAFYQVADGLLYGDDPKEGIREGRTFSHPDLKMTFTVPEGFEIFNGKTAVVARDNNGAVIVFDMGKPKNLAEAGSVTSYLTRSWASKLKVSVSGVERINVNGLDAATGISRVNTRDGKKDARFIALHDQANDRLFRLLFLTPPDRTKDLTTDLQRMTYSFRLLSDREAAEIKPLRIRIHKVRQGETVRSIAEKMPFPTRREERFRVLNGFGPEDQINPGQRVKIVTKG
ncbi:MAG: M48 family metalloprotease [Magnetovibrionaceae bacterium]